MILGKILVSSVDLQAAAVTSKLLDGVELGVKWHGMVEPTVLERC